MSGRKPASSGTKRVKTGCVTCRIRRVKRDEVKPYCTKCTSTGRRCDGYTTLPFSRRDLQAASSSSSSSSSSSLPIARRSASLGYLELLPRLATDPAFTDVLEKRYFQFFRQRTAPSTSKLLDGGLWNRTMLQASHQEPAIKHAVLALSSLHQLSELPDDSELKQQHKAYAEKQHQKALQQAQALVAAAKPEDIDRVLLVCIIFVCYEGVRGDYAAMHVHIHNGRQIVFDNRERYNSSKRSDRSEIVQALSRLDIPALTFQDTSCPTRLTLGDYLHSRPFLALPEFEDMFGARAALVDILHQFLLADSAVEYAAHASDEGGVATFNAHAKATCASQFEQWQRKFELLVGSDPKFASASHINILRIWHTTAALYLEVGIIGKQSRFDVVPHRFIKIVSLAEELISELGKAGGLSFSVDGLGYLDPVFLVATRCREPGIRRRALGVLLALPRQESLWQSAAAAAVASKWIAVEEEGLVDVAQASDIHEHRRIQALDTCVDIETRSAVLYLTMCHITGESSCRVEKVQWSHRPRLD